MIVGTYTVDVGNAGWGPIDIRRVCGGARNWHCLQQYDIQAKMPQGSNGQVLAW